MKSIILRVSILFLFLLAMPFSVLATENEQTAEQWYEKGSQYLGAQEYDYAIAAFTEAIKREPKFAKAYNSRGMAYSKKLKNSDAIDDFTRAIELSPAFVDAYMNRADSYAFYSGFYKGLAKALNATELPPQYWEMTTKANNDYNKAVELSPQSMLAHSKRGVYRYANENMELAITDFNKALELSPNNGMVLYYRGRAFDNKRQYEEALRDYNKAISINADREIFYYGRALVYVHLAKYQQAIADFKKSIERNPKQDPIVYFHLAQSLELAERKEEALAYYQVSFNKMLTYSRSRNEIKEKAQSRLNNDWQSHTQWLE